MVRGADFKGMRLFGGFAFSSKEKALCRTAAESLELFQPPRVKITLTVVSTSTGSLLSR